MGDAHYLERRALVAGLLGLAGAGLLEASHQRREALALGAPVAAVRGPHAALFAAGDAPQSLAIEHGPRGLPEVALTFHGEGEPGLVAAVLDVLAAQRAYASVFAVGRWLQTYPAMAQRVLTSGHELGNHSWSGADTVRLSDTQLRLEVERCRDLLVAQTGSAGVAYRPAQMRHATPAVLREARRAGYAFVVTEDVDPQDFRGPGTAVIVARALSQMVAGSVLSLHFTQETLQALPVLLQGIARAGLRPVTVGHLLRTTPAP